MTHDPIATTNTKRQAQIPALAARLDAAELELNVRDLDGEHHSQFDFVDPATRVITHRADGCPWCAFRALASKYRAAVRAPHIKRGHRDTRRLRPWEELWNAKRVALTRLGDGDECPPCADEYGTPIPEASTMHEKIDAQAELEMIEVDMELAQWRNAMTRRDASTMNALGLLS